MMNSTARRPSPGFSLPIADDADTIPAYSPTIQGGADFIPDLPAAEHIPAGTVLATQDERPTAVRLVRSGIVKLIYLDGQGQEFVLGLRSEGWWTSSMQVLLDVPSLFTVQTITPCDVSTMSADDFSQQLVKNPRMLRHYLSSVCREVVVQTKVHIMLLASSAENRLRQMLDEHDHSVWKTLDPTAIMRQGEVAKLLAITPEHLSRILHKHQAPSKQ